MSLTQLVGNDDHPSLWFIFQRPTCPGIKSHFQAATKHCTNTSSVNMVKLLFAQIDATACFPDEW